MNIHWIVYLIIGILVTSVSTFIEKFVFFIVVGVIFIFIGVVKFILRENNDATKRIKQDLDHTIKEIRQNDSKNPEDYIKCKHCKAYNYPHAEMCHYCGRRVK
ncbi:hypothetical protein KY334_01020 [Candidatus Woesearchaeota archaeon]|nr:hypothetical protein [Candidatus Woesearchaeota archaeon]